MLPASATASSYTTFGKPTSVEVRPSRMRNVHWVFLLSQPEVVEDHGSHPLISRESGM
jgi:hypothetical protein